VADARPPSNSAADRTPLSLLERARANDAEAWRRLVALYGPLVRCWIAAGGVPAADAEDVSQEVFTAAAGSLGGFRRDRPGDTFRGWLRGVTRNQVLLYFRRNRGQPHAEGGSDALQRLQEVPDPLPGPGQDEAAEAGQLYVRALEQVRGDFDARTWQAFWRTAIDGRTPVELAGELGATPAAIRQAKSRVLRRIRQELGDLLG
jgi:RNA polymerase sigma-70 factor (ECF subfamily)